MKKLALLLTLISLTTVSAIAAEPLLLQGSSRNRIGICPAVDIENSCLYQPALPLLLK